MIGYKLTNEEADLIDGKLFNSNTAFKPMPDINGDKHIFDGEVNGYIEFKEFFWVRELQPSTFIPPINNETII